MGMGIGGGGGCVRLVVQLIGRMIEESVVVSATEKHM